MTTVLLGLALATSTSLVGNQLRTYAASSLHVWLTTADGANQLTPLSNVTLGAVARGTLNVSVDDTHSYQTEVGFGAAFTDSSTFLMANLKANNLGAYSTMINQLFSASGGIGLSYGASQSPSGQLPHARPRLQVSRRLRSVLNEFLVHYHQARPHQSLDQHCPERLVPARVVPLPNGQIVRLDRIGGSLREYSWAV